MRVNASMGCQKVELISYDLIFNVMSKSLLTGSSMKICDLLGSTCPVTGRTVSVRRCPQHQFRRLHTDKDAKDFPCSLLIFWRPTVRRASLPLLPVRGGCLPTRGPRVSSIIVEAVLPGILLFGDRQRCKAHWDVP